ncbi:MAG: MFS transporter [Chloroflexaceae bacterium]
MPATRRYRWFVVGIFFCFMLLHQTDRLLIGPLTTPIMTTFGIDEVAMGAVFTGALLVGAVFYPIWGYLYDRFSRARLLALAAFIWGTTTWLSARAPTFPLFLASRASTGVDDASYPGIFSLVADYFGPGARGKVNGLLNLTAPLGYMLGLVLALLVGPQIGWRNVFFITGIVGVGLALVIFSTVREVPRGQAEPELADLETIATYRFDWRTARSLLRNRTLLPLYTQGFFGVFPWNVIAAWFFRYLEIERDYTTEQVLPMMTVAVLCMAAGNVLGGALGDWLFTRTRRGRLLICLVGVLAGVVALSLAIRVPPEQPWLFAAMLCVTGLFIPFSGPNVIATVHDITPPEVRSRALAIQSFIESAGAALAPLLVGILAVQTSLTAAIQAICVATWLLCAGFLTLAIIAVPRDIERLRSEMRRRAYESVVRSV